MTPITAFTDEFRFLSNFWLCLVELDGKLYPSVEHAYQAAKTLDLRQRRNIQMAATAGRAKRLGRGVALRGDWDDVRLGVMELLLRQKFSGPYLQRLLIQTGNRELIEGNTWGDRFWGAEQDDNGNWIGENYLGRLLMKIRDSMA